MSAACIVIREQRAEDAEIVKKLVVLGDLELTRRYLKIQEDLMALTFGDPSALYRETDCIKLEMHRRTQFYGSREYYQVRIRDLQAFAYGVAACPF